MTTTIDPTTAANERELPACPTWCEYPTRFQHDYDEDSATGQPVRFHEIYRPEVFASTSEAMPNRRGLLPYVSPFLALREGVTDGGELTLGEPRVIVAVEGTPSMTSAEARQVAANLLELADRADEISASRT